MQIAETLCPRCGKSDQLKRIEIFLRRYDHLRRHSTEFGLRGEFYLCGLCALELSQEFSLFRKSETDGSEILLRGWLIDQTG